jgi:predicted dehydrogenase
MLFILKGGTTMQNARFNRRRFLGTSSGILVAGVAAPYLMPSRTRAGESPNDRLLVGCIGMGGMGRGDARGHAGFGDIVAVCDVDAKHAATARDDGRIVKGKADVYTDYRRLLDRSDIDVVSIGTPDHWHTKPAIEALMAGKHVFIQKPLTLTLEENQLVRAACKRYPELVFFIGTQQRSDASKFLRAVNMVQKGLLGDIQRITVGINGGPQRGPFEKTTPPPELDWDMWLGQAPMVDYIKERCHGNFRWWYEYSGGKFTDWGAHHVDIATWAIGYDQEGMGPLVIDGTDAAHPVPFEDGYPTVDDCFNTAHDYAVKCMFPGDIEMIVTSRGDNGILFEGSKGRIFVNRRKITGTPIEQGWDEGQYTDEDRTRLYRDKPHEGHKHNFYRCIREGGLPVSDVFSHVQTMNTCHLCAIAARFGRAIRWDAKAEKILGDDQAASLFARQQRAGYEIPRV